MITYSAGRNQTRLSLVGISGRRTPSAAQCVPRAGVTIARSSGRAELTTDQAVAGDEKIVVGLISGYRFKPATGTPLVWETSEARCEQGVLFALPIGAVIEQVGYMERRASEFYRATERGLEWCADPSAVVAQV